MQINEVILPIETRPTALKEGTTSLWPLRPHTWSCRPVYPLPLPQPLSSLPLLKRVVFFPLLLSANAVPILESLSFAPSPTRFPFILWSSTQHPSVIRPHLASRPDQVSQVYTLTLSAPHMQSEWKIMKNTQLFNVYIGFKTPWGEGLCRSWLLIPQHLEQHFAHTGKQTNKYVCSSSGGRVWLLSCVCPCGGPLPLSGPRLQHQ